MNNNLINFINEKMMKLDKEISTTKNQLTVVDKGLYNKDVLKDFTEKEINELRYTLYKLENKYNMLRDEYKNLNIIRMNVLGLI